MNVESVLRNFKKIVVIGISPNPTRPSHYVSEYMQNAGYEITGVNPGQSEILGRPCFGRLSEVSDPLEIVAVFRASEFLAGIVAECLERKVPPKVLWIQLDIEDAAAEARAEKVGITVIRQKCLMVEHRNLSD